jgi:tRNA(Ile)-lysidine synthase
MAAKRPSKQGQSTKRHKLLETLRPVLREQFGVVAGERIGLGVSGGADSVALLRLFVDLREELGIVPCVVHFNHQLRGKDSDADERFVAELAAQHDLEFFLARENIAAKAKRERANLEDAARRARYAYFEQLVKEGRMARVAVAHTAEDQAETVLAHMLRGTGLAGLSGIHPETRSVFRPLLAVRRGELRAYLKSKKQSWREDVTNLDTTRTRARMRLQLMPFLEKRFNAFVVAHLCQLAELAREDNEYLERECELRICALAKERGDGLAIPARDIALGSRPLESHSEKEEAFWREGARAMAKRMVRQLVQRAKARAGELSAQHVEAVLHLAQYGHSGKILQLPGGVEVRRERDALLFRSAAGGERSVRRGMPCP